MSELDMLIDRVPEDVLIKACKTLYDGGKGETCHYLMGKCGFSLQEAQQVTDNLLPLQ